MTTADEQVNARGTVAAWNYMAKRRNQATKEQHDTAQTQQATGHTRRSHFQRVSNMQNKTTLSAQSLKDLETIHTGGTWGVQ